MISKNLILTLAFFTLWIPSPAFSGKNKTYNEGILTSRAEIITGEFDHLANETQGYVNFLTFLNGAKNTTVKRPPLDMRVFKLSWLQDTPGESELDMNVAWETGAERIGEFPGKATLMTGSRHFIDRMGLYRGHEVDLLKYEILPEHTGRIDLCVGISIPEALVSYFPASYIPRLSDGKLYITRSIIVPTGYGDIDLSGFLSQEGGEVSGILGGQNARITADFLRYGNEERKKVNTSTAYDLLVGLFDKGALNLSDLPPLIKSLHGTLIERYLDDINKRTGTVLFKTYMEKDPELREFVNYVRGLYFTSQELEGKLESMSSIVIGGATLKEILTSGAERAINNYAKPGDFRWDDIVFTGDSLYMLDGVTIRVPSIAFDSVDISEMGLSWQNLLLLSYGDVWGLPDFTRGATLTIGRNPSLLFDFLTFKAERFKKISFQGRNIEFTSFASPNHGYTGDIVFYADYLRAGNAHFAAPGGSPLTFEGGVIYLNGELTFIKPPVYNSSNNTYNNISTINISSALRTLEGDNIVAFSDNGSLILPELSINGVKYKIEAQASGLRLNGKTIIRDQVDSVDVSEVGELIPVFIQGVSKGSLSEAKKREISAGVRDLREQYSYENWDYLYDYLKSALGSLYVFKSGAIGEINNDDPNNPYLYRAEKLVKRLSLLPSDNKYNDILKQFNPDFDTSQISGVVYSLVYEISGKLYNAPNFDILALSLADDFHERYRTDNHPLTAALTENIPLRGHIYDNIFELNPFPFEVWGMYTMLNAPPWNYVLTEPINMTSTDRNIYYNEVLPKPNILNPGFSPSILSNAEFKDFELDDFIAFNFGDEYQDANLIEIPSFKLYITPRIVFLAR